MIGVFYTVFGCCGRICVRYSCVDGRVKILHLSSAGGEDVTHYYEDWELLTLRDKIYVAFIEKNLHKYSSPLFGIA